MQELQLSAYQARQRILLFQKLRKGKTVTDQTVKDLEKLLRRLSENFKDFDDTAYGEYFINRMEAYERAFKVIRNQFMRWEKGGNTKFADIDSFAYHTDEKYRVVIKGQERIITKQDYMVLSLVFYGEIS